MRPRSRFRRRAPARKQIDPTSARIGVALVDSFAARSAVASTAARLLAVNGDTGSVSAVSIDGNRVTVSVTITTTGRPATGTASATAVVGVDAPLP